jgi:hypothetical protein
MIELAPKWIMYDEFWHTLKRRNLWLITLRYVAVIMLLSLILIGLIVEGLRVDALYIGGLAAIILIYNTIFHRTHSHLPDGFGTFHGLHFALLQMIADFLALLVLTYLTGGVESPFFYFFIFHRQPYSSASRHQSADPDDRVHHHGGGVARTQRRCAASWPRRVSRQHKVPEPDLRDRAYPHPRFDSLCQQLPGKLDFEGIVSQGALAHRGVSETGGR